MENSTGAFQNSDLVHQISLWLTSLFVIILYITWHSAVLKLSIYTSALGALIIFFFFFVKSERLKDLTVICMHCPFLKYDILFILFYFFIKTSLLVNFWKKKNPPLLYATDKLGEMALAYLKRVCPKKSMPRESLWQCKIHLCTSLLQKHQYVSIPWSMLVFRKKIL